MALEAIWSQGPPMEYSDADREPLYRLDSDRHFLVVAGRNLLRALEVLGQGDLMPRELAKDVKLLRDCFEHWDDHEVGFEQEQQQRGRAIREHHRRQPMQLPTSYRWERGHSIIGGILLVQELAEVAERIRQQLVAMEADGRFALVPPYLRTRRRRS